MAEEVNINYTVEKWAEFVVKDWQKKIKSLKIGKTDAFTRSFAENLFRNSGGDIDKVALQFLFYGRFVDMGVGKGVRWDDVGELKMSRKYDGRQTGNRRKPKRWYSQNLFYSTRKLAELLSERYAEKSQMVIMEELKKI